MSVSMKKNKLTGKVRKDIFTNLIEITIIIEK